MHRERERERERERAGGQQLFAEPDHTTLFFYTLFTNGIHF
jgi:hypothetical protein